MLAMKNNIDQIATKTIKRRKMAKRIDCPICNKKLDTDDCVFDIESHIENCIALAQFQNFQTTKIDSNIARLLPSIDIDIDVETGNSLPFGAPQYSDQNITPKQILGLPTPLTDKSASLTTLCTNTLPERHGKSMASLPSLSNPPVKVNLINKKFDDAFLLSVIANQQHQLGQVARCRVCLESSFRTPLVSTLCWHVLCEECWLSSLNYKRVCPTCSTITSPECLRKIFL